MSLDRDKAKHQIKPFSDIIMEHIIKLVMYSDIRPDDVNGWIDTIANWISRADNITVKPSAKKLKETDLMSSLFSCMGDDIKDYTRALYSFQASNQSGKFNHGGKESYPEFDVSYDAAVTLMHVCYEIIDATMPLLRDKADHSKDEYVQVVSNIFAKLV